jgi:meso-butanediol dehydrogenase/(S,S)-butanediol dehydrogenase/diacetyl reductase
MKRLQGKVALVTGSGRHRGLGEAISRRLAAEGARVLVTDLGAPQPNMPAERIGGSAELEDVAAAIRAEGGEALAHPLDVRNETEVETAIAACVKAFGRLDILVNNAGIGYLMESVLEMSKERWEAVLDVNLMGTFLCTKHAARQMVAQGGGGRIVNIASQAAKSGSLHLAAYAASKHGMLGFTRTAAMELGVHGITVNAICPNHVTTGLGSVQNEYRAGLRGISVDQYLAEMRARIPLGRVGLPEDTARACAFLCSDEAVYITGEGMNVSGGIEMH